MAFLLMIAALSAAPADDAALYVQARTAELAGHHAAAAEAYAACAALEGPFREYALLRKGVCRGASGDGAGAIAELQEVLGATIDGPWVRMGEAELAKLLSAAGRNVEAAALYEHILAVEPRPWWYDRFTWAAVDNLLGAPPETGGPWAVLRHVLETNSSAALRARAAGQLAASPRTEDKLLAAHALVDASEFKKTDALLAELGLLLLADGARHPEWEYLQARVQLGRGEKARALPALKDLADSQRDNDVGRLALAAWARGLVVHGSAPETLDALALLSERYPDAEETVNAHWFRAWTLSEKDRPAGAAEYLRFAALFPGSPRADDAFYRAAQSYEDETRDADAAAAYEALARQYPASPYATEALCRLGRLQEKRRDRAGALESYSKAAAGMVGDFYTHRAADAALALGGSLAAGETLGGLVRPVPVPGDPPLAVPEPWKSERWFQRFIVFARHGFEEAEWEALHWAPLFRGRRDAAYFYTLLADEGLAMTAHRLIDYAKWGYGPSQSPSLPRLRVMYPRAYWPAMASTAGNLRLDPYLLLALGRQESTFRARVGSSAGARGVMQLMPSTAKWLADVEPAVDTSHVQDLGRPENSIHLGGHYLRRMLDGTGGGLVYALAAYNAGPGNVSKWRRTLPADAEAFIAAIPYTETRNFVRKVLGNYAAYHSIYPPASLNPGLTVVSKEATAPVNGG